MSGAPASQSAVREALRRRLELEGLAALYRELGQKDPVSAARISPNDAYRILRALEVYESSGAPLSSFPPPTMIRRDFKILLLALTRRRDELYARIDERVDQMFEAGLYREFLGLKERGYTALDPGLKSRGYREFFEMQSNGCLSLAGVKEKIRQNSRHYAKSQMTYFKGFKSEPIEWFDPGTDLDKIEKRIQLFFEEGD
jgi:tRNA dimethylallyltransferase